MAIPYLVAFVDMHGQLYTASIKDVVTFHRRTLPTKYGRGSATAFF